MGAIDPLSLLHACPPEVAPRLALQTMPIPGTSPDRAVAKGTPSSSVPSGDTWRKSPLGVEGMGYKDLVGASRGWEVVGTQLYSPQVRILTPWTKRQTDR